MEVVLYLVQKIVELVQTFTGHLAVECAIGANISHSDIGVHSINLEQRTHQGCLRIEPALLSLRAIYLNNLIGLCIL